MRKPVMHARQRVVWYNQKTVVAVCGIKTKVSNTTYHPLGQPFNCVGCRAIVAEQIKELIRDVEAKDRADRTSAKLLEKLREGLAQCLARS